MHFSTYSDSGYADRLVSLLLSAERYHPGASWSILALDSTVEGLVSSALPSQKIHWVKLDELDEQYPALKSARESRSLWDGYLTARCHFVYFLLKEKLEENTTLICMDADVCFFSSLDSLIEEFAGAEIGITPHRFASNIRDSIRYGIYNAGITIFKNTSNAQDCVSEWCRMCRDNCSAILTDVSYTDQKYLNAWPASYRNVKVINHSGVNMAPWNLNDATITVGDDNMIINGDKLLLFHFHGFREITQGGFYHGLTLYKTGLTDDLRKYIYQPYIELINAARLLLKIETNSILLPLETGSAHNQKGAYESKLWAANELTVLTDYLSQREFKKTSLFEKIKNLFSSN